MWRLVFGVTLFFAAQAEAGQRLSCDFKGVGSKEFARASQGADFASQDGTIWQTLETEQFLQLRSAEINTDYVTNPFTVYLFDKNSHRMRQISGAMRAAPMMADGICQLTDQ